MLGTDISPMQTEEDVIKDLEKIIDCQLCLFTHAEVDEGLYMIHHKLFMNKER